MLTADQVRVRRRGDQLTLPELTPALQRRLRDMAARYLQLLPGHLGQAREALLAAWGDLEASFHPGDRKQAEGLKKLILDGCRFDMLEGVEPLALRMEVFGLASARRQALADGERLDRDAVLREVAAARGLRLEVVDAGLFADLKDAHLLSAYEPLDPDALVARYQRAQGQAVLLRATHLTINLDDAEPAALRRLFHQLKFHRLLFQLHREPWGGHRLEIDGPMSLFQASTKYGLQLALCLPLLDPIGRWRLHARVLWGAERRLLDFRLEGGGKEGGGKNGDAAAVEPAALAPELSKLCQDVARLDRGWEGSPAEAILDLPGVGLCVPDLVFTHAASGARVYFELLGYWSREAVWRRVELVEAGLAEKVLFAVSERLRVSEAALGPELPGALYVFKGVLSAARVVERLERLAGVGES